MPDLNEHYEFCGALDCAGCLPSDEEVGNFRTFKDAQRERRLRKIPGDRQEPGGPRARDEAIAVILADADDYRARSAAAREALA